MIFHCVCLSKLWETQRPGRRHFYWRIKSAGQNCGNRCKHTSNKNDRQGSFNLHQTRRTSATDHLSLSHGHTVAKLLLPCKDVWCLQMWCLQLAYSKARTMKRPNPFVDLLVQYLSITSNNRKQRWLLAFKKTNQNTHEVKNERFLISTRQNNVRIFGIRCL